MDKYAIVIFNTAILEPSIVQKNNVKIINLHVFFEQEEFLSDDLEELFDEVSKKNIIPTSSQPTTQEIIDVYEQLSEYEHVFVIAPHLSISGTYNNALLASKEINTTERFSVYETNATSFCETLMVKEINNMQDKSIQEIQKKLEKIIPTLKTYTIPGTFEYLKKSGRVNLKEALIGRLISLKLLIQSYNGDTCVYSKSRGFKGSLKSIENLIVEVKPSKIYVTSVLGDEKINDALKDIAKKYNIEIEIWANASKITATHLGPKTIGFALRFEE